MFEGKAIDSPFFFNQYYSCILTVTPNPRRIKKEIIQSFINRIRKNKIKRFGNLEYTRQWIHEKAAWRHCWTFAAP